MRSQRITPPTLSRAERRAGFGEVVQALTDSQAVFEANRCLYCYDAPCIQGCPAGVQIPEFIARIRSRNLEGAAHLIYRDNPLGATCGRICPVEALCEKACTSRFLNVPIAIGDLQRFVCDKALQSKQSFFSEPKTSKGRVAVIGGGPAGLSCAHYLLEYGCWVDLFEREACPGGLLRSGIPTYRLPEAVAEVEIEGTIQGVNLQQREILGVEAERILSEYDAVFLGVGLGKPASLGIPGEDLPGIQYASDFLRSIRQGKKESDEWRDKEVAVVGGGAAAMDAARSSLRLGASRVTVLYRRTSEEMPAFPSEYMAALEEGVEFSWLVTPVEIRAIEGRLEMRVERMSLGEVDASGRARPIPTGSTFEMKVDSILIAIASRKESQTTEGWGDSPKIFRGGDLNGGATVVQAVADGKVAAAKIASWLENGGSR